jgi:glycosyltransferase involved in cell wall biosynthesis
VRGLCAALAREHDTRLYAAQSVDRRGRFGEPTPAIITGVPGWPSWLKRYGEMREVRAARCLADRVLHDAFEGWTPDVIIERHTLFSDAGWRLHDRLGRPWVLEVNAPPVVERSRFETVLQPRWADRWERQVLLAAPVVVAVSRWLVRWLTEEVGCRNVRWIPNGVVPVRGDRERGRRLLGVAQDEPLVGFVGSMRQWHGIERLGRIAVALHARLALIGPRPADLPLGAVAPGYLRAQDLADAVAALDLALAPYPEDTPPWFCPLKLLDYRAQGTPVVAGDVGDVREILEQGGTVVPPADDGAYIEAGRRWLGRRTHPRVRSWQTVSRQVLEAAGVGDGSTATATVEVGPP